MFNPTTRFITRAINEQLPPQLVVLLWRCIDESIYTKKKLDYLQVFTFSKIGDELYITHTQEQPKRKAIYHLPYLDEYNPLLTQKIFVIDSESYSTMLYSHEY